MISEQYTEARPAKSSIRPDEECVELVDYPGVKMSKQIYESRKKQHEYLMGLVSRTAFGNTSEGQLMMMTAILDAIDATEKQIRDLN